MNIKDNIEQKGISWAGLTDRCLASRRYFLLLIQYSLIHDLAHKGLIRKKHITVSNWAVIMQLLILKKSKDFFDF